MSRAGALEQERKLAADPDVELPDLTGVAPGVVAVAQPVQRLDATYYDTDDLRLARSGVSVRFRTGEDVDGGRWTVKLPEGPAGPSLLRREIDVPATSGRALPAEVQGLVRAHIRSARLRPVRTLRTVRRRVELLDARGDPAIEVADDDVSVLDGRRVAQRFRELEVEVVGAGGASLLPAVVARLERSGAAPAPQMPKVVRALGPRALEPPDVRAAALDPDEATMRDVVGEAIAAAYLRLVRHDAGVRLGGDPDDVHQARVAARRLRSDLRTFRDLLDTTRATHLRDELRWIGAELGSVRDADVLLERLRRQTALLPAADTRPATALLRRLEKERDDARRQLLVTLDGRRYVRLLDDLAAAATEPPVVDDAGVVARKALPAVVRGPWKHLQQAVDALDRHPEDEALHDVRIRAKRARYAAEAAAPILGKPAARFAKAVAGLQSVLGDLQDAVVAEAWLRRTAAGSPPAQAMVAGELVALQREAMVVSRRDWPEAWDDVARKKLRAWLG
ncbi:MAG TPA: CYTH and CHAD domain-containing protein [Acidimicrobiales bacterium]|nr:CYTH and CHAD domain-containing protein [Acidimicrobiales bacterium]